MEVRVMFDENRSMVIVKGREFLVGEMRDCNSQSFDMMFVMVDTLTEDAEAGMDKHDEIIAWFYGFDLDEAEAAAQDWYERNPVAAAPQVIDFLEQCESIDASWHPEVEDEVGFTIRRGDTEVFISRTAIFDEIDAATQKLLEDPMED